MGWWRRFCIYINKRSDYPEYMGKKIAVIRRDVRARHPQPSEYIPIEAQRIRNEIRIRNETGDLMAHTEATALWELAMQMYPEHITETDKPILLHSG